MNKNAECVGNVTGVTPLLNDDVSKVVAKIGLELAALDRTTASGGTPMTDLTKLGAMMHALAPDGVPIGSLAGSMPLVAENAGPPKMAMLPHVEIPSIKLERLPHVVQAPVGLEPAVPRQAADFDKPKTAFIPGHLLSLQSIAARFEQTSAAAPVIRMQQLVPSQPNMMQLSVPIGSEASVTPSITPLPSYYSNLKAFPEIPPVPYSASFETLLPGIGGSPVDIDQASSLAPHWSGTQRDTLSYLSAAGAGPPMDINLHRLSRTLAPAAEHFIAPTDTATPTVASAARAIPDQGMQFDAPSGVSDSSDQKQDAHQSRQGILYMDGAQLGRWVVERLAKYASRPTAGTTGIDPRITASYPGAPVGG